MKPWIKNQVGFSVAGAGLVFLAAAACIIISNFIPQRLVIATLPAAGHPHYPLRR